MRTILYELGITCASTPTETIIFIIFMVVTFAVSAPLYIALNGIENYNIKKRLIMIAVCVIGYIPARWLFDIWFIDVPGWIFNIQYIVKLILMVPVKILTLPVIMEEGTLAITAIAAIIIATIKMITHYVLMGLSWIPLDCSGAAYTQEYKDKKYETKMVKLANQYLGFNIKIHRVFFTNYISSEDAALMWNIYMSLRCDTRGQHCQ